MDHNNILVLAAAERICLYHNIQAKLLKVHSSKDHNSTGHNSIKVLAPTVRNHSSTVRNKMGHNLMIHIVKVHSSTRFPFPTVSNHNSTVRKESHPCMKVSLRMDLRNILVRCSFHQLLVLVRFRLPGICPHRLWQPMPWSN